MLGGRQQAVVVGFMMMLGELCYQLHYRIFKLLVRLGNFLIAKLVTKVNGDIRLNFHRFVFHPTVFLDSKKPSLDLSGESKNVDECLQKDDIFSRIRTKKKIVP